MIETRYLEALELSASSGVRYQVYGRKNHGVWGYSIAPTFQVSRRQVLAVAARESKTPTLAQ